MLLSSLLDTRPANARKPLVIVIGDLPDNNLSNPDFLLYENGAPSPISSRIAVGSPHHGFMLVCRSAVDVAWTLDGAAQLMTEFQARQDSIGRMQFIRPAGQAALLNEYAYTRTARQLSLVYGNVNSLLGGSATWTVAGSMST